MKKGIIGLGLFLLASTAHAGNVDIDGTNCLPAHGGDYTWSTSGSIINFGSGYLDISCPIINESGTITGIEVYYIENNPNADGLCVLSSGTGGGGVVKRTSGASTSLRTLSFTTNIVGNQYGGTHVRCTLPPNTSGAAPTIEFIRLIKQ